MQEKNNKISPIKKRILQFIDYKGITKATFCEMTGISYPNLNSKSLESEIGGAQITLISSTFNEISLDWLILGKGEMLRIQTDSTESLDDLLSVYKKTIEAQKTTIETQRDTIIILKEKVADLEDKLDKYTGGNTGAMAG